MPATADGKPPHAKQTRAYANTRSTFRRRSPPSSPPAGFRSDAAQRPGANTPRPKPAYSPRLRSDAAQTPARKQKPARRKASKKPRPAKARPGALLRRLRQLNGKVLQVFPKSRSKAKVNCPCEDAKHLFRNPFRDITPSNYEYAEARERALHGNKEFANPVNPDAQQGLADEAAFYRRVLGENSPLVNGAYGEDLGRTPEEDPHETIRFLLEELRTVSKTPEGRRKAAALRRQLREAREMLGRPGHSAPPRPGPGRTPGR